MTYLLLFALLLAAHIVARSFLKALYRVKHSECSLKCCTLANENALLRRDMTAIEFSNRELRARELELQMQIFTLQQAQAEFPKFMEVTDECAA
jgi:hypothetical protein